MKDEEGVMPESEGAAPQDAPMASGLTEGEVVAAEKPIRELIAKLEKQLADATAETAAAREELAHLKREHEHEADRRSLTEAERFADALGLGATREIAQALHQLRKSDPEAAVKMEWALRRTSERLRYSQLLGDLGLGGPGHSGVTSAQAEAEARAQEIRKSEKGLTREQALAWIYEEDQDLFSRVMAEDLG